jgi:hypothetical protein
MKTTPTLPTMSQLVRDLHARCDTQTLEQRIETRRSLLQWATEREKDQLLRMPTSGRIR